MRRFVVGFLHFIAWFFSIPATGLLVTWLKNKHRLDADYLLIPALAVLLAWPIFIFKLHFHFKTELRTIIGFTFYLILVGFSLIAALYATYAVIVFAYGE